MNEQKGVESIVASSRNSLLAKRCLWLSTTFAQRCEDSLQAQLDTHNCFKNLRMTLNDRFQNTTREINSMVLYNFWICFARIAQHRLNNRSFLIIVDEDRYWRSSLCLMRLAHRKAELSFENRLEWMNVDHHRLTFELRGPTQALEVSTWKFGSIFNFNVFGLKLSQTKQNSCDWPLVSEVPVNDSGNWSFAGLISFYQNKKSDDWWCTCALTNWISGHDEPIHEPSATLSMDDRSANKSQIRICTRFGMEMEETKRSEREKIDMNCLHLIKKNLTSFFLLSSFISARDDEDRKARKRRVWDSRRDEW